MTFFAIGKNYTRLRVKVVWQLKILFLAKKNEAFFASHFQFPFITTKLFYKLKIEKRKFIKKLYIDNFFYVFKWTFFLIKAFGISSKKTIEAKDKNLEFLMGNRAGLTFYDIKTANLAYKCSGNFIL